MTAPAHQPARRIAPAPPPEEFSSALAERRTFLVLRRRRLRRDLSDTEAELAALDILINARQGAGHNAGQGTRPSCELYIATLPPGTVFTVAEATIWANANGWRSAARDREMAIATALAHIVSDGVLIERVAQGTYRVLPPVGGDHHG